MSRPIIIRIKARRVTSATGSVRDQLSITQNCHAVCNFENLLQIVGNIDHRRSTPAEVANDIERPQRFLVR
jgi:hypothetical protein